ncbi:MAG: hypothetical protein OSA95_12185, partial [Opitutales bacterium]|nr:hypothetical protein [Opitutales bacterium]
MKTAHVPHSDDTDPYFFHLANILISPKGINQETSGATWTKSENLHDMGNLGETKIGRCLFQLLPHAQVNPFRTSALSTSQVMMVAMAVIFFAYWRNTEKVAFPLLDVMRPLVDVPEEGKRRIPDLFRQPIFWYCFSAVFLMWSL